MTVTVVLPPSALFPRRAAAVRHYGGGRRPAPIGGTAPPRPGSSRRLEQALPARPHGRLCPRVPDGLEESFDAAQGARGVIRREIPGGMGDPVAVVADGVDEAELVAQHRLEYPPLVQHRS